MGMHRLLLSRQGSVPQMDPAWHGQGIMTAVIRALVHDWAVPRMNARHICVSIVAGNIASVRVFEKNGFKRLPDVHNVVQMPESKGGLLTGLHRLEWRLEEAW